jgi:hypothetical protein
MKTTIAILLFLIFLLLSLLHVYWMFGGQWGSQAVIPTKSDDNKTINLSGFPTLIVAIGLFFFSLVVLVKSQLIDSYLPLWFDKYILWAIAGIFILRAIGEFKFIGFFKKYKHTKFGRNDTKYYSPLCLIIGLLAIILELSI